MISNIYIIVFVTILYFQKNSNSYIQSFTNSVGVLDETEKCLVNNILGELRFLLMPLKGTSAKKYLFCFLN